MADDKYLRNRQKVYDLLKGEGYSDDELGGSAEELFKDRDNASLAFQALSNAGYSSLAKDEDDFVSKLYAPEAETQPVTATAPVRSESQRRTDRFNEMVRQREAAKGRTIGPETPEQEAAGKAEVEKRMASQAERIARTQKPVEEKSDYSGYDYKSLEEEYARKREEYAPLISEYEAKMNVNLSSPEDFVTSSWLGEHNTEYNKAVGDLMALGSEMASRPEYKSQETAIMEQTDASDDAIKSMRKDGKSLNGELMAARLLNKKTRQLASQPYSDGGKKDALGYLGSAIWDYGKGTLDRVKTAEWLSRGLTNFVEGVNLRPLQEKLQKMEAELKPYEGTEDYDYMAQSLADDRLTDEDKVLLASYLNYGRMMELRENNVPLEYRGGQMFADTAGYMIDFLLTRKVDAVGRNAMGKALGKWAPATLFGKGIKAGTLELGGAFTRTLSMVPQTLGQIGDSMTEMENVYDDNGNVVGSKLKRSVAESVADGLVKEFIDVASEGSGEIMEKAVGTAISRYFKRSAIPKTIIGRETREFLRGAGGLIRRGQIQGLPYEDLEEILGGTANTALGKLTGGKIGDEDALKQTLSKEAQQEMLIGFLPFTAVTTLGSLKAANRMQANYDESMRKWEGLVQAGAGVTEEDLNNVVDGLENKSTEDLMKAVANINDKIRKSGVDMPETEVRDMMNKIIAGRLAYDLQGELWENSEDRMAIANAYASAYGMPIENNLYDITQTVGTAEAAAKEQGFTDEELGRDASVLMLEAEGMEERGGREAERAETLKAYAMAKAQQQAITDGYQKETADMLRAFEEPIMNLADNNGTLVVAQTADGQEVYVASKDAIVGVDGKVSAPTGPDGLVSILYGDGTTATVKANTLAGAQQVETETYLMDKEYEFNEERAAEFQQAQDTISASGMAQAVGELTGQTVFVNGNGAYEPVRVERMTHGGEYTVISGDKEALKGIATALGIQSPGGSMLEAPTTGLYEILAKDDDGSISTDMQAAPQETAPQEAPAETEDNSPESLIDTKQTITYKGQPLEVTVLDVSDGKVIFEDGDGLTDSIPVNEFYSRMQAQEATAPVAEPEAEPEPATEQAPAEPAATEVGIPIDETTGEPIYDAEGVTPEQAYNDIYGRFGEDTSDADSFVVEQSTAADKAYKKAQKASEKAESEKAEIDKWKRNPGEGLNAFAKRKADAKAEVDKKTAKATENIPELKRKADFWNELREVADANIAEAKAEAERQKLIEQYGVDPSGFDLTPQTMEEALADELYAHFKSGYKLSLASVLDLVGWNMLKDLRKGGYGFVLSRKPEAIPVDKFVMGVADEYPGLIKDEQDAINMVGDLLMRNTRGELGQFIFNARLEEARKQAENEEAPVAEAPVEEEIPVAEAEVPAAEEETVEDLPEEIAEEETTTEDMPEEIAEEAAPAEETVETPAEAETETEEVAEETPAEEEVAVEEEAPVENIEEENTETASETEKESVNSQSVNETQEEAPAVESELTEDEIRNSGYPDEDVIDAAIDYINGDRSISSTAAYNLVKEYVRPQRNATEQTRGDADGTQLDGPVVQPTGVGAERSGGESGELGGVEESGTAERIPGNPDGGVPAGEGGTASTTGAGRESDVQDSGSNVRGGRGGSRKSGRSNADVPAENGTPSQSGQPAGRTEAGSTDIAALGGELEDLLKQFGETNYSIDRDINGLDSVSYSVEPEQKEEGELSRKKPKKPTVPLSFEGLTPKQIELAGKIIFSSAKIGYAFVKTEGLASFNDFRRWFKSKFGDAVMKGLNYDESSLDAFINEVWNTKLKIDGQRLTLAQHASELHNEELRRNSDLTPAERTRLQKEANEKKIPFKAADRKNIAEALPQLNPGQWDDLVAIERQFYDPSHDDYDHAFGKGMMITNGTGTGKTYTGLGTIKRFVDQGKGRILLVAPAGMTSEWVEKGKAMGIKMSKLADTKDKGEGVVVTSYQNFRENKTLYEDDFDLVVYDESHNILENQQGDETIAYEAHKRITNKNVEEALDRLVANTVPGRRRIELENENKALEAEAKKKTTKQGRQIEIEMRQTEIAEEIALLNPQIEALKPQFREHAQKAVEKTKVLFLSATPFNTIENLKYAEGYIYQYPKVFRSDGTEITDEEGRKSAFVTEWFRGDEPMEEREIAFGDHLLDDLETVSYRELENGFDHSRDFPDVSGNIMASRFNFAFQSIMRNPKYNPLKKFADSLFGNSTWTTQLYETMKASALRDRLKEHLDAGRKIVIFHDRMHESKASDKLPAVGPPFQTILDMALMDKQAPIAAIMAFKQEFVDILKWEAGLDYRPVQEQVVDFYATDEDRAKYAKKMEQYEKKMEEWRKECDEYERAHPNMEPEELFANLPKAPKKPQLEAESVAIYNGEKTDKEKEAAKAAFNDDNSKVKIICVTTRSGGAGLSLHDTTGKHPRVMIQTALPVSPIGFIQAEGRIFRWGNKSNAAFEYPRLGLDVEAMKFAMDFNAKAETVENLAHGFRGRGLKDSIMTGFYENSGNVPIAGQGIGGVEMDKRGNTLKGMAKAKHDYGVAQRKGIKAGDKSIPETIGYVLSGWGMMQSGDQALIPFAGRGSIARYMPKGVGVSALEQDIALQADLFVTSGGDDFKLKEGTFTELNPINKADVVILNGNTDGGLNQIETMRKGFLHLSEGGRLIAIVPDAEKEIEFTIKDLGGVLRSTILVNNSAIDAGNEGVSRIIVVDKVSKPAMRAKAGAPTVHDLTKAEKEGVPALIEAIKMPERIIDKQAIAIKKIKTVLTELRKNKLFGAINVYDESGARARVGFEMANRLPKGTNQSKYRFDSLSNRGFYYTGKWFQIPYSDFEKVNENNYLITAYQWLKEVVALPDDAFIRKAEIESNASKETIDAFRDMYRQYMKFIRAGFGLTEAQIQRVASGLQPDISAADIDTLNSYSELRAKFEAANHGDEERQDLYDKVAQVGEKIGLTIGAQTMDRDFLGGYNNKDNTLMVNKNRWNGLSDEKRAQTLLHEFIHSVTVYAIAGYTANAAGMSDALFDAAKLAADVYDQITKGEAVDVRPFTGQYSIENEKELLAEMANSETKEKLQNRRMWVVRTPRGTRVSGSEMEGAEQTTAWNLLNEALDGMLKNFDKSLFDRFRGRVSDFFFELDRDGGYTRDADLGSADMRENGSTNGFVEEGNYVPLQEESFDWDIEYTPNNDFVDGRGNNVDGLNTRLRKAQERLRTLEPGSDAEVQTIQEINGIKYEQSLRNQRKSEWKDKYHIGDDGRISLEDLSALFRDTNTDPELAKLFEKVAGVCKQIGLDIRFSEETQDFSGFSSYDGKIRYALDFLASTGAQAYGVSSTILHELIHSVTQSTTYAYNHNGKLLDSLTAKQKKAVEDVVKAFDELQEQTIWVDVPYYAEQGLQNVDEMIAEMANPTFREFLKSVPTRDGKKNFLRRIYDAIKRLFGIPESTMLDKIDKAANRLIENFRLDTFENVRQSISDVDWDSRFGSDSDILLREETDADILERLESEPKVKAYRAMQFVPDPNGEWEFDLGEGKGVQKGNLYPPMSAKVNGKWRNPVRRQAWERSVEQPELAREDGTFLLDKGNKKSVPAAYNPYFHSSATMLNDQFAEAQSRDNLVVVEVEIPEREVSARNINPYKAEKAKDAVGVHEWKAGPIQGQLSGTRSVYLSRWDKPMRIVPVDEVAYNVEKMIRGQVDVMPTNVVWPQLREELEKLGVKFVETNNQGKLANGKYYATEYKKTRTKEEQKAAKKAKDERTAEAERIRQAEILATDKTLDLMGEELGVKINKVSRSEMPTGHRTDKGYYNPATGEMTICMDNVTDERDAIATVLHETVGHKGLRELFGPRFREAMTNIYASLDRKGRAWVNGYIASHGLNFGDEGIVRGMEEYMAHLAESGDFQNTVWDRIKEIIGKIVDLVFGTDGFVFTDRELNYILRASYEHLKDPNWLNTTVGKAKDTLWKRELGINETDPNRPTDPDGPGTGILFRDGETGYANEDYNDEMDLWHNQMIMENQDADRPVKIGMEKVMKETGKKEISEDEDYLRRHNVASSRAESEAHNYELFHFTPLLETVRAIQEKLISGKPTKDARQKAYERVLDYIYAVSGLERNEYKNNEIEQQKQEALEGQTDPKKIAKISAKYDAMKRDWAGITSLTHNKREDWQKANADAQALVDDFKAAVGQDALLDELWDRIRSCTDYSLEHAYKYGLLTREEFERLHGTASQPRMWEYYVPLRGFNEETAEEVFDYSSFLSPSNDSAVVKKMKGRWTQADNPLANILNIAESEIVQGNDNWAKQALYRFTLDAGENSLLTQVEPWYVKNPATGTWTLAEPDENESLEKFEERMQALADMDTPLAKKGRRGLKLDKIMANKAHRNEHMIRLKVRGVEKMIWVNGNPALAKAVTGIGRSQNMQWLRRASRVLSNLFTTYSLDFSIKNLIRDTIYSRTALIVKEDKAYRRKFAENWRKNFGYGAFAYPMVRLAADWESGKLQSIPADQRTKKQQMFIDFMTDGGQTGYTIINSVNEIKKSLERSMRRSGKEVGGVTVPILGHYAKAVKTLNEGFELLTRFTAYETSRDMGRSGLRSASDAKEISVNFNRRGAQSGNGIWGNIAAYLGATHYFYNAGVQGFENFLRLFKTSPKKMGTITVGIAMMGILTPLINSMFAASGGGDDDWYWNLPEWVRRNNLIIGTGRSYLAIPLPVEFRAIYGLGDIAAAAFCYQKYPNRTFGRVAGDMISTASGILPVNPVEGYTGNGNFGDAVIRAVAPDAGMFFVDWATNRDYTGRPLWKENPFSDTVPKSQGAYASTPKGIVNACQALAQISAGAIDVPPGLVRDFMNNYGGGFFRAAEDVSKIITGVIGKDPDRPFRYDNIPFLSGFTGHIDEDRSNSFATNALREYKEISEGIVKKVNAVCNTDEITAAMVYGDKEIPEQYRSKVRVQRILSGKDYLIGKEYRDGMNNKYKMKQYVRGDKIGQWYKSKEVEEFGVNALKKKWSDLREEWAAMPSNTEDEKSARAEKHLEVDDAWHEYYNAEGDLAEKLMKIEYGKQ